LYIVDRPDGGKPDWTYNMLLRHGVRSCLEYAKSFDLERARALSNPQLAPHLEFVDLGGHGYVTMRLTADEMRTEFVCIPRPITRSASPDGGPLRYRVALVAKLWKPGERPRLKPQVLEGDVALSICPGPLRRRGAILVPGERHVAAGHDVLRDDRGHDAAAIGVA
jgi:alkaline phosphatase D